MILENLVLVTILEVIFCRRQNGGSKKIFFFQKCPKTVQNGFLDGFETKTFFGHPLFISSEFVVFFRPGTFSPSPISPDMDQNAQQKPMF